MTPLQIAQSAWDNMLPRDHHDDATEAELSEAADEFRTDTFATSMWLCDNLRQPEGETTCTRQWWGCHNSEDIDVSSATCLAAREELRDRMQADCAAQIEARVPSIRASNIQDAREYQADCYRDDAHHWF